MTRTRYLKVSALAATVALLTGCGVHPGAAAVVGDTTITTDQVDAVASAVCAARAPAAAAQGASLPSRGARQYALSLLIDSAFSLQFGKHEGVQPDEHQVSAALNGAGPVLAATPAADRAATRQAIADSAAGGTVVAEVGRRYLLQHGTVSPSANESVSAGQLLRARFVKTLKVDTDPRYGTFRLATGALGSDGGSLSVPASAFALAGSAANPGQAWTAALPASQKCS